MKINTSSGVGAGQNDGEWWYNAPDAQATPLSICHTQSMMRKRVKQSRSRGNECGCSVTVTVPRSRSQLLVTSKCTTCRYLWLWEQAAWQPPLKPQIGRQRQRERRREGGSTTVLCYFSFPLPWLDISSVRGQQRIKLRPMHAVNCPHIQHTHTHTLHTHTHTAHPHTHIKSSSFPWALHGLQFGGCNRTSYRPSLCNAANCWALAPHRTHTTTHFAPMPFTSTSTSPSSLLLLPLLPHNTNVSCFNSICWQLLLDLFRFSIWFSYSFSSSFSLSLPHSFYYYARHSN